MSHVPDRAYTVTLTENTITITVDLTQYNATPTGQRRFSGSGKNWSVATTRGNKPLQNGMIMGLNIYESPR